MESATRPDQQNRLGKKSIFLLVVALLVSSIPASSVSASGERIAASVHANPEIHPSSKGTRTISWKWSDGVPAGNRNFSSGKYSSGNDYPTVVVTIKPRNIPRIVSIAWLNGNSVWREQNRGQSVDGVVSLQPDLDCYGIWFPCSGVQRYQIVIEPSGDQPRFKSVEFSITYDSGRSGSSSSNSSGSSASGGVSAASFIGWNLEDVQDYLGYDPRTLDCSGWGRSVWWSSNWWVIGTNGGSLIVSKSRSRCS